MKNITYIARLVTLNCGKIGVEFPDVPSAFTEGDNREHAIEMAKDVLALVLDVNNGEVVEINNPRSIEELESCKELKEYETECDLVPITIIG